MSGGEIAVVPAALVLAPVVAVAATAVAGVGLAAALTVRAARAGTEATGRALEQFADQLECHAKAQDDREIQARLWGLAAGAVVHANQELRLLAGRAERARVRVPLPEPYDLTGRGLTDTRDWVVRAQQSLASAQAEVERAEADRERRVLLAKLPVPADASPTAAELLASYARTLAQRRPAQRAAQPPLEPALPAPVPARQVDQDQVRVEIDAILGRLDIDATAAERADVILAAARVAKQREAGASRTYLSALARKVDQEINPRAAGRRQAAVWLAGLEHPVVVEAISQAVPPLPPHLRAIGRLQAVVRGEAELTAEDRRDAQDALAWAQKQVDRRRLLEVMAETFNDLGYAVTTGMQVHHSAALRVARDTWHGGHSADVWIDEAGHVRWQMLELAPGAPAEASRCQDLNQSMYEVGGRLTGRGFDVDVQVPAVLVKPIPVHDGHDDARRTHETAEPKARQQSHEQ